MPTHKLRCARCRQQVRVVMDTAQDCWVFTRHWERRHPHNECPNSGRPA